MLYLSFSGYERHLVINTCDVSVFLETPNPHLSSAWFTYDRRRSQVIAICDHMWTMFYSCDRLRSSAIECDLWWTKFCDHAIGMCPIMLWFPSVQHFKRHDTMTTNCLSLFTRVWALARWKVKLIRYKFMKEIRKDDCLFNRFSKEFKDKFKKINAWSKVGEVFSISPAAAEKKFRDVRTAYGRYLRRRKSVPSGSGRNAVPIPREFVNLEWLSVHIEHREPFADSVVTNCYDRLRSYVNMLCAIFGWVVSAIVRSPAIVCDYMWTRLNGPQCP